MASSLGQLFQQIIESEQKTQEKKDYINKCIKFVKNEHARCLQNIKLIEEKVCSVQYQLLLKTKESTNKTLEKNWLTSKVGILKIEHDEQLKRLQITQSNLTKLLDQIRETDEAFCNTVKEFSVGYDMCSNGHLQREQKARDKLQKFEEEEKVLIRELSAIKLQQEKIRQLQEQRSDLQKQIALSKRKLKKIDTDHDSEKVKVSQLQEKKLKVSKIPHTEIEFKRLQAELEAFKEESMESLCLALQQELQELQQKQWQKDLQKKREMQQQQRFAYSKVRNKPSTSRAHPQQKSIDTMSEGGETSSAKQGGKDYGNNARELMNNSGSSRSVKLKDHQNIQRFSNFKPATVAKKGISNQASSIACVNRSSSQSHSQNNSQEIDDSFDFSDENFHADAAMDVGQFSSLEQLSDDVDNASSMVITRSLLQTQPQSQNRPNLGKLTNAMRQRKSFQPQVCAPVDSIADHSSEKLSWKKHQEKMKVLHGQDAEKTPQNSSTKRFLFNKSSSHIQNKAANKQVPTASMFAPCSQDDSQNDL